MTKTQVEFTRYEEFILECGSKILGKSEPLNKLEMLEAVKAYIKETNRNNAYHEQFVDEERLKEFWQNEADEGEVCEALLNKIEALTA